MCLTEGFMETLSLPAKADKAGLAPGPLGRSSCDRDSDVRLTRSKAGLAVSQRTRRIVAVERFDVERPHREGDIIDGKSRSTGGAHEAKRLYNDLADSVFDILSQALESFFIEGADADRLCDILDIIGIPEKFGAFGCHGVELA
ncbi:hypothetical protein HG530_005529 [Fusarium avenaceum]|nr:hypothetical protein HG530_005529 [Fusarium avenaceum]